MLTSNLVAAMHTQVPFWGPQMAGHLRSQTIHNLESKNVSSSDELGCPGMGSGASPLFVAHPVTEYGTSPVGSLSSYYQITIPSCLVVVIRCNISRDETSRYSATNQLFHDLGGSYHCTLHGKIVMFCVCIYLYIIFIVNRDIYIFFAICDASKSPSLAAYAHQHTPSCAN